MSGLSSTRAGILLAILAYTIWGLLPLYIRALRPLPPLDILAHRILWSLLLLSLLVAALRRHAILRAVLGRPRILAALLASALLIGSNWTLYIVAINSGHTLQASLGYFINPLVNVMLGVVILRERLGLLETLAVLLAAAGVAALAIGLGTLPILSLGLAVTFGLYGLVRKMAQIGPIEGLLIETALLAPLAIGWLLLGPGLPPGVGNPPLWMLAALGLVTSAPLLAFAAAARRIRYTELGLLQYIAPTMQLIVAVWIFGEALLPVHLLTFALIWSGLLVYAFAIWRRGRAMPAVPE